MKTLFYTLLLIIGSLLGYLTYSEAVPQSSQQNLGASLRVFTSGQVGTGAVAGYVLQTDGGISNWVATSTLGLGGGGSQTPWTSDIDAAGYNLYGIGTATGTSAIFSSFTGYFNGNLNGTASTSQALATNGANCAAGSYPLGVDASGAVENCTDATTEINSAIATHASDADAHQDLVTLAGTPDYITISGQVITRGLISLADDVTGTLSSANIQDAYLLNTGDTGTGTYDFSGATVKQKQYPSFTWPGTATTTSATTTIPLGSAYVAEAWNGARCKVTASTGAIIFGDGTNQMNGFTATTTYNTVTLSTNNTFTAGEARQVEIGALTAAQVSCTLDKTVNN